MPDLILHQYADSPFSEKIRALFGYKGLAYKSVDIPPIMPKPDLTALTGGYRRTPVMQQGADIFCDTALIAKVIESEKGEPSIFGGPRSAQAVAAARWADSEFFRVCVGLVFQPAAVAANPRFADSKAAEAFIKDRAAFTAGSPGLATPLPRAEAVFREHLGAMEETLLTQDFLGGSSPDVSDFSHWHCCWFVHRQAVLRHYFETFPAVSAWLERMQRFSDEPVATPMSGAEAIEVARSSDPAAIDEPQIDPLLNIDAEASVQVMPTDYGFQAVTGQLLVVDDNRIIVARQDPQAGQLHVHFPRYGFEVSLTGEST
ncbi:glutathione S-transferase [Congregibacter variabilis]|uniref:Glutathione S-transferase n=1 Tax=Congregibacter variabilis TaxID=3081200 RepID=A0ABZ0I969_9GAMM|nr:glutathione S-transferase [Congregibacter sp. IMCC43200]